MNNTSKPGNGPPGKKKSGRPRNEPVLNTIAVRPPPPAPNINEIQPTASSPREFHTSPVIRSPIDQTPIVVNGKVVDLDSEMEERVLKASPVVRPITPVNPQELPPPPLVEEQRTPPALPLPDVNIVETPPLTPVLEEPEPDKPVVYKDVVKVETISTKPLNFTSVLTENNSPVSVSSDSSTYLTDTSSDSEPKVETKSDPFEITKSLNLVGSRDSDEEYESESESDEEPEEEQNLIPTLSFPADDDSLTFPTISGRFKADSPIETIGAPQSPPVRGTMYDDSKPMFSSEGKSFTPRRVSSPILNKTSPKIINKIQDNSEQTPTIRNVISATPRASPRRSPSPIRPGTSPSPRPVSPKLPPKQIHAPSLFLPPQPTQGGSLFGRPNYGGLTPEQEAYMRSEFKMKFGILRSNYPQWDVVDPPDALTLDQIHDLYEYYIRQIIISKETGQYKVYLVLFFMFVEVIGVKILKLNMSGYTMSQLRIMNRYDSILSELGEKWLISSGSEWPVEARLLMMAVFNAVIFLAVRYLCSWMGVDGLSDTIQNFVDNMLNGPSAQQNNGLPQMNKPPTPVPGRVEPSTGNPLDGLTNAFAGIFGGGNSSNSKDNGVGGFAEGIAKVGTMLTGRMQQSNANAKNNPPPKPMQKNKVKGRIDKKTLFG